MQPIVTRTPIQPTMNTSSLREILRVALPPGSVLLTPPEGSHQHVAHAVSLRATPPAFPQLRGGEIALINVAQARLLDERLTLPTIVRRLADVPVAAIAVLGPVDDAALQVALDEAIALIHLPDECDLRSVERDIQRLLVDPDVQIERRAAQLYSELTLHLAADDGAEGIVRLTAERTGSAIGFLSAEGEVRIARGPRSLRAIFSALHWPPPALQTLTDVDVRSYPVGSPPQRLGYLAIAAPALDHWDELAAQQAAAALTLEAAKQQAVQAAEARIRGDILRTILSGTIADPALLHQQAVELGYDLRSPHIALVIAPADGSAAAQVHEWLQRLLTRLRISAPNLLRDDLIICFCPSDETLTQPTSLLQTLSADSPITAGLSTLASSVAHWPRAYDEAEQSLLLGRQLFGAGTFTAFSDLGVYRLLLELRGSSELRGFYLQTLGALVEHDRVNGGEMLHTLEGYFNALGNLHQAADALHIHRNTLIYRLRRITEISGLSLKRAEDVLALQVAIKAHRILTMKDEGRGAEG
jgi:PucR family transcriptional regulator, purine catabolism regulatory protein